ncbi:DUF934 domain-containing protein [Kiloniella laminariae]|uniref:DUF934 domain-containing protein n=1 Tax=Kiloniella laminariae TaxID=454162 RepID=A0ABT4LLD6_9PROT|nr:DUF934 domain-containing protein [Kiloniella laminariae]MCZ4281921.1 DUF934 domain-containing protein [Kiloniella laminariae]
MALIKDGLQVTDSWIFLADEDALPDTGDVVVSLARWQSEKDKLFSAGRFVGLRLESDQSPELIEQDLLQLSLIALNFPSFGDGRAYSYARILRERYGFKGELRAVGNVLFDQIQLMRRCGFDAFEVTSETALKSMSRNKTADVNVYYQPAADGEKTASSLRRRLLDSHKELGYDEAS